MSILKNLDDVVRPGMVYRDSYGTPFKVIRIVSENWVEVRLLTWYERLWRNLTWAS